MAAAKRRQERAPPAPRNDELEAAIVDDPDSPDAYLVYGDWLLENGDPLGELVSVQAALVKKPRSKQLLERERALLAEHDRKLGGIAELEHTWSFGFLESVTIDDPARDDYSVLFDLVPARFLRELDIELNEFAPQSNDAILAVMARLGFPPALRKLAMQARSADCGELGNVSVLYPRLARIKELTIRAAIVTLGAIHLPALETFAFESLVTTGHLRSLAAARWPRLKSLSLGFANARSRVVGKELAVVLSSLANLRHLGVADHHEGDALVHLLVDEQRPLLAKLTSLDLSRTGLTDAGAKVLLDNAETFEHMDSIDLRENLLSSAHAKQLEKALSMVDVEDQGMRDDGDDGGGDHYDDIEE